MDDLPDDADVVIVGGGVMGTSTAFFLARETDRDVLLLEKDAIAAGSTGDSSAILRHHYGDQAIYSRMAWWSHEFYRRFEAETGQPLSHAENPLVRFGVEGTPSGEYAQDGYEVLSELDVPVTRYERESLPDRYPMVADAERYDFAVSDDAAGYSDGSDAARGFERAAREQGATVVTGTAVESIVTDENGSTVVGVDVDGTRIACSEVVIAAGPWTPRLAETVGVELPIVPTREQVLLLDPPAEYAERYSSLVPTTALPGGEWYVRPDVGGGILVGTHHTGEAVDPNEYDATPDESTILELVDQLGDLIPELRDAGIQGRYCGIYSNTPDHDFIIDAVGPAGCYVACGFSGHGFKQAPAVGRIVTDLVTEGTSEFVDLEYFSLSRFEGSPEGHGAPADNV
ncbi:FAD-dependent oxidoreductase [Halopenitus sp. POP-27]|uniref:NAD(P)/FAD-dependent oxidoreductase n=1 Tax=Halopenitus sp. POP-27 TaxID=2994425 RepID=UPI002469B611|nr:FAD-dependent oxidoreductase [Halopenitus sp. POP-27]